MGLEDFTQLAPRTLWSTAITPKRVYVTVIVGTAPRQRGLYVSR